MNKDLPMMTMDTITSRYIIRQNVPKLRSIVESAIIRNFDALGVNINTPDNTDYHGLVEAFQLKGNELNEFFVKTDNLYEISKFVDNVCVGFSAEHVYQSCLLANAIGRHGSPEAVARLQVLLARCCVSDLKKIMRYYIDGIAGVSGGLTVMHINDLFALIAGYAESFISSTHSNTFNRTVERIINKCITNGRRSTVRRAIVLILDMSRTYLPHTGLPSIAAGLPGEIMRTIACKPLPLKMAAEMFDTSIAMGGQPDVYLFESIRHGNYLFIELFFARGFHIDFSSVHRLVTNGNTTILVKGLACGCIDRDDVLEVFDTYVNRPNPKYGSLCKMAGFCITVLSATTNNEFQFETLFRVLDRIEFVNLVGTALGIYKGDFDVLLHNAINPATFNGCLAANIISRGLASAKHTADAISRLEANGMAGIVTNLINAITITRPA